MTKHSGILMTREHQSMIRSYNWGKKIEQMIRESGFFPLHMFLQHLMNFTRKLGNGSLFFIDGACALRF